MLKLKSKYPIGIEIGNHNIFAAQLKPYRNGFAVRGLVHREMNGVTDDVSENVEALVPVLREIAKNKQFSGKKAVVQIPIQHILSFPVSFQVGKTETLEEAILRESKEYLPFPVAEAIIDYPSLISVSESEAVRYKATIVAVHRDHIRQYMSILKRVGLVVEAVDFRVSSLIRLHNYLHNVSHGQMILCHIGHTQSLLAIVGPDSILAQRYVPWGIQLLLGKIKANLELTDQKDNAKIILKKYGLRHENRERTGHDSEQNKDDNTPDNMSRIIYQILTPLIEELIHEFHKIIGYVRAEEQNAAFEKVYLYGQATLIRHLDFSLHKRLNIPTKLIDPMTQLALTDNSILPDKSEGGPFALALGLAMRKVPWL
jgi:type IV pilus assembly protein PilM